MKFAWTGSRKHPVDERSIEIPSLVENKTASTSVLSKDGGGVAGEGS
jgi:hypothetical protein